MTEGDRPVYCGQCGSIARVGDKFCGACGAEIPPDAQEATPAEEIPTRIRAPRAPPTRGNRRQILAVAVGALLVLLAGTGAAAYAALGPGIGLLGWSGSQPSDAEGNVPAQEGNEEADSPSDDPEASRETTTTTVPSVSPDAPPDPAFDKLLPTLRQRTSAVPIMLPADLPSVLENVALNPGVSDDGYEVAFFREPQENVLKSGGRADTYGTLRAAPAEEGVSNEHFEAVSVETFEMPDGAEATLRRMEPVREQGGTQGPFWEGKFEEGNHAYTLILRDDTSRDMAAQVLSTIVEVPRAEEPGGKAGAASKGSPPEERKKQEAAKPVPPPQKQEPPGPMPDIPPPGRP